MLRYPTWQATDDLTRTQLSMFHGLGDQLNLPDDDRRRALDLDDRTWKAWTDFMADGPLPTQPDLPEMLRRISRTAYNLSVGVK
jgi:hypothetical protein